MKKAQVTKGKSGFRTQPTAEYAEKQEREQRIRKHLVTPELRPATADIYQLLLDVAARQSEIYDLLKQRT